jgi:hypothetical protein
MEYNSIALSLVPTESEKARPDDSVGNYIPKLDFRSSAARRKSMDFDVSLPTMHRAQKIMDQCSPASDWVEDCLC